MIFYETRIPRVTYAIKIYSRSTKKLFLKNLFHNYKASKISRPLVDLDPVKFEMSRYSTWPNVLSTWKLGSFHFSNFNDQENFKQFSNIRYMPFCSSVLVGFQVFSHHVSKPKPGSSMAAYNKSFTFIRTQLTYFVLLDSFFHTYP